MFSINTISFAYAEKKVIENINFSVKKGAHIAIMGESGCGKSTLLKALYGLLNLSSGEIRYNDNLLLGPEHYLVPGHPFMKYLAQEFDLMPFISAAENIGEFLSNFYPEKKQKRIAELLKLVGMTNFANVHVRYLSGGQKQRIALARVLAKEPEILLLDEPFSQIDNFKKNQLRYRVFKYLKEKQITCITATHDKEDVLAFAEKVCVLKNGKQLLFETPQKIYNTPKNNYVASLLFETNLLSAKLFYEEFQNKKVIIFPHEIKVSDKSNVKVVVQNNFFKGDKYTIFSKLGKQNIVFDYKKSIIVGSEVGIIISKNIVRKRLQKIRKA